MTRYSFHPSALSDLDEIWEYLHTENAEAADRLVADVLEAVDTLANFPWKGHARPDLTSRPLRFIVVHDYLIAYAPDENPLCVIAVIHGRRNPRLMERVLRSRQ